MRCIFARPVFSAFAWRLQAISSTAVPRSVFFFFERSTPYRWRYHCLKSVASTCTIAFFTSVFVRTSSLFEALYTTSMMRTLRVWFSLPQEKLPESRRRARTFVAATATHDAHALGAELRH